MSQLLTWGEGENKNRRGKLYCILWFMVLLLFTLGNIFFESKRTQMYGRSLRYKNQTA